MSLAAETGMGARSDRGWPLHGRSWPSCRSWPEAPRRVGPRWPTGWRPTAPSSPPGVARHVPPTPRCAGRSPAPPRDPRRSAAGPERSRAQQARPALPALPSTTIGSFPQIPALRAARAAWRSGPSIDAKYRAALRAEVDRAVDLQEALGLDVVVHGEPERDDVVRHFADRLAGFSLPEEGWEQPLRSPGSVLRTEPTRSSPDTDQAQGRAVLRADPTVVPLHDERSRS